MGAKIFAETSIRQKAAESVLDDSSPIGSMHMPRDRFSGQIRVYFEKAQNAEHGFAVDLPFELGSGSHSGHRLGYSDYNKCSVGRSDLRRDYSSHSLNLGVIWQDVNATFCFTMSDVFSHIHSSSRFLILTRLPHNEWKSRVSELKSALDVSPHDLGLAVAYWEAISGSLGYDVRDGKRAIATFQECALRSDDGLAQLIMAFRKLADDSGELPRESLFSPPLENLLRMIARHPDHRLSNDAAWVLGFLDSGLD